jgi:acetylglutamate kinase
MSNIINLDVTTKAAVLLEALPYIQRFRDAIFVVKYGGAFMDDANPEARARVATDIAFLHAAGIKVVVVHGGGKAITRALAKSDVETQLRARACGSLMLSRSKWSITRSTKLST